LEKLNIETYLRPSTPQVEAYSLSNDIILSLLYFDIFHYPLTIREIFQHSTVDNLTEPVLKIELENLVQKKMIQTDQDFFSSPPEKIW
jgi:hypothetical protein